MALITELHFHYLGFIIPVNIIHRFICQNYKEEILS